MIAMPGHPGFTVAAQITHHFAPAGGMPDVDGVTQIEMVGEFSKVVCIVVEIVPDRGLRRASMSATVVRDHPIPVPQEEQHLGVPAIDDRPAVAEDTGCPDPQSFVENFRCRPDVVNMLMAQNFLSAAGGDHRPLCH